MPPAMKNKKALDSGSLLLPSEKKFSKGKDTNNSHHKKVSNKFEAITPVRRAIKRGSSAIQSPSQTNVPSSEQAPDPVAITEVVKSSESDKTSSITTNDANVSTTAPKRKKSSHVSSKPTGSSNSLYEELMLSDDGGSDESGDDPFKDNKSEIKLTPQLASSITDNLSKPSTKTMIRKTLHSNNGNKKSGAIYLAHIPHGFYEQEMFGYFRQFGRLKRLRLGRSKRTGKSRSYAFIEFEHDEVAKIVADTMNDYLMLGRRLQCRFIPSEQICSKMFYGPGEFDGPRRRMETIDRYNQAKSQKEYELQVGSLLRRESERRKKFQELGIDYDFGGFSALVEQPTQPLVESSKAQ